MDNVKAVLSEAIESKAFPGACYAFGTATEQICGCLGQLRYDPEAPSASSETQWDLASVTKVMGTTTVVTSLCRDQVLSLDQHASAFLPRFGGQGKDAITLRNLMTHTSGLIAFRPYHQTCSTAEEVYSRIDQEDLQNPVGAKMIYSDLSMIVMQRVLETVTNKSLAQLVEEYLLKPFGLLSTTFRPDPTMSAPTEPVEPWREQLREARGQSWDGPWIQGEVHDPTATAIGGVAGHAGLFSTVTDVARFCQLFLADQVFSKTDRERFTTRVGNADTRALGWDTKSAEGSSAGTLFGGRSFGHTGFTGTSVWMDPDSEIWAVLLTNRVHPTAENRKIIEVRPRFHDAVYDTLIG